MLKQTIRRHLEKTCSHNDLCQWFDPLRLEEPQSGNGLVVHFPHKFFEQWFMAAHQQHFEQSLKDCLGENTLISYSARNPQAPAAAALAGRKKKVENKEPVATGRIYSFADFIPGKKNFFPVETMRRIASGEEPLGKFNPLVLWGDSGSGKTHLLRALAHELTAFNRASIFFCTPEELKTHYDITKPQRRARQRILAHNRLIVDDLQKIYNMEALQDELVLLFDALHEDGKQLVFAGLHKPGEAEDLNPRLRSRLEGGLCLAIKEADLEVRIQYINDQCAECGLYLNKNQVLTLAARFEGLRQLGGIIKRLAAYSSLTQRELLESDFESMVRHAGGKTLPEVTSSQIINLTASHLDLSPAEILGSRRTQEVVMARQIAMFLCRELLNSSYPELGKIFGGKDHSTIMYAVKKIKGIQKLDQNMHKLLTELRNKCLEMEV